MVVIIVDVFFFVVVFMVVGVIIILIICLSLEKNYMTWTFLKGGTDKRTHRHMDIATYRLNRSRGRQLNYKVLSCGTPMK